MLKKTIIGQQNCFIHLEQSGRSNLLHLALFESLMTHILISPQMIISTIPFFYNQVQQPQFTLFIIINPEIVRDRQSFIFQPIFQTFSIFCQLFTFLLSQHHLIVQFLISEFDGACYICTNLCGLTCHHTSFLLLLTYLINNSFYFPTISLFISREIIFPIFSTFQRPDLSNIRQIILIPVIVRTIVFVGNIEIILACLPILIVEVRKTILVERDQLRKYLLSFGTFQDLLVF